jgi:hypothetical protein
MIGDYHVWFWSRGEYTKVSSTITLSYPGAEQGSKGSAVRRLKWYMSWV